MGIRLVILKNTLIVILKCLKGGSSYFARRRLPTVHTIGYPIVRFYG